MKRIIIGGLFLLVLATTCSGQFSTTLPNYVKAENSHCIINFITPTNMGCEPLSRSRDSDLAIDPTDYATPQAVLFATISQQVIQRLKSFGMHPGICVNATRKTLSDHEKTEALYAKYQGERPGFTISIQWEDDRKALKSLEKGKFTLNDVAPVVFSIANLDGSDGMSPYLILNPSISLELALQQLGRDIAKQDPEYFLTTMKISKKIGEEFDLEATKELYEVKPALEAFPTEEQLSSNKLLVVSSGLREAYEYTHANTLAEKWYPYEFDVVQSAGISSYSAQGYRYCLWLESGRVKMPMISVGTPDTDSLYKYHYVLKDLEMDRVYHGPSTEKFLKTRDEDPNKALKQMLMLMAAHYGWEKE